MKQKIITILSLLVIFISSCDRVKKGAKNTINKGGEIVGETATEFIEGVSEGVDKTLECEIYLSQELKNKGIKTGKFSIQNDSADGINNVLSVYLIFDKNFDSSITAKIFDKHGLEIGRKKIMSEGKIDDAGYYDFVFDKRSRIEAKSKIILE